MTDEEPSVRDNIMALYLQYGEREFGYLFGVYGSRFDTYIKLVDRNPNSHAFALTKKALKLIGEET